jgi:hypothetical protein
MAARRRGRACFRTLTSSTRSSYAPERSAHRHGSVGTEADATITPDRATLDPIVLGQTTLEQALDTGSVENTGDASAPCTSSSARSTTSNSDSTPDAVTTERGGSASAA